MESWQRLVGAIVKDAKSRGELDPDLDPYELATVVTGMLEGALMLTEISGEPAHVHRTIAHLTRHVEGLRRGGGAR